MADSKPLDEVEGVTGQILARGESDVYYIIHALLLAMKYIIAVATGKVPFSLLP